MSEADAHRRGQMDRLAYTPAEIAAAAGLSRKAIYRAIENGELRAAKVCSGSRLLIPCEAAREWIDANLVTPRSATRSDQRLEPSRRRAGRVLTDALARFQEVRSDA
jgi:excisionase family DNA binding protein